MLKFLESILEPLISDVIELSLKIDQIQKKENFEVSYKDIKSKDPLTTADLFANEFLQERLTKRIENSMIISEELPVTNERFQKEFIWIIDPIDGTRDFVNKKNTYSISIGLIYKNHPLLGIISMPAENYLTIGYNDQATIQNNYLLKVEYSKPNYKKIKKNHFHYENKTLEKAKILVSESEYNKGKLKQLPSNWNLIPTGSVARKLAMIAWGEGDLMISLNPKNEWDVCAGIALIYASHQIASTLEWEHNQFKKYEFNKNYLTSYGLVAGNPYLVEKYLEFHKINNITVYSSY